MKHSISSLAASALLTLGVAALAGCADEPTATNAGRQELRLTATIEGAAVPQTAAKTAAKTAAQATTRAVDLSDDQIAEERWVHTWVWDAGTNELLYDGYGMQANGDGTFSVYEPEPTPDYEYIPATMYFPQSGNAVEISAMTGTFGYPADAFDPSLEDESTAARHTRLHMPGGVIPFWIPTWQWYADNYGADLTTSDLETYAAMAYMRSDLLYARQQAARTSSAVDLTFYHMLSKIEVELAFGTGLSISDVASITLDGVRCGGTFSPANGDITSDADRAAMITATPDTESAVRLLQGATEPTLFSFIVIPQQVAGKTLTITLKNDQTMVYTFPTGAAFASGCCHFYKVMLRLTGLTVTSVVNPWNTGAGDDAGEATIPGRKPAIGDYLLADGSWVAPAAATDEQLNKVIGVVFQTDPARMGAAEKKALRAKGVAPHGLAVATKMADDNDYNDYVWYMDADGGNDRDESEFIPNVLVEGDCVGTFEAADADIDGYAYNMAIRTQRADDYNNTALNNGNGAYPAFKVAEKLDAVVPPPAKTTGWYLPSNGQWFDMVRGLGGISLTSDPADMFTTSRNDDFYWDRTDIGKLMNAAMVNIPNAQKTVFPETNVVFWTSSAATSKEALCLFFTLSRMYGLWTPKSQKGYVRPILAF